MVPKPFVECKEDRLFPALGGGHGVCQSHRRFANSRAADEQGARSAMQTPAEQRIEAFGPAANRLAVKLLVVLGGDEPGKDGEAARARS